MCRMCDMLGDGEIWYLNHLVTPSMNVIGASMPNSPGIVIGHNESLSWGMTNVMTDYVDLYVVKVDPANPERYFVDGEALEMDQTEITITVAEGETGTVTISMDVPKDKEGPDAFLTMDVYSEDRSFTEMTQFQVIIKEKDDGPEGTGLWLVIVGVAIVAVLVLVVVFFMATSKKGSDL